MAKFVYVVLHYKNIDDTLECLQSIQEKYDAKIVVVDNATLQTKEKKQLMIYTNDIIELEENKGFAKANNIGCQYAIEKYKPDFLVVINNDIIVTDPEFEEKITKCYQKNKFDMLGPKINTNDGDSVNPFNAYTTIEQVDMARKKTIRNIKMLTNPIKRNLFNIYHTIKYLFKKDIHLKNGSQPMKNVPLHGCAIIFSKKYYQKYPNVFYNETFLYHEEEFLYYRVMKDNLVSYYDPNIECFHKEGSSLNFSYNNDRRKREIFRNQEILKSLNLLYDIMKDNKKI